MGGFPLLTVLIYVADEHPAAHASVGAQALQTGVVRWKIEQGGGANPATLKKLADVLGVLPTDLLKKGR